MVYVNNVHRPVVELVLQDVYHARTHAYFAIIITTIIFIIFFEPTPIGDSEGHRADKPAENNPAG